MLFDQAKQTLSLGDSLLLSVIGMLVVFMELILLALMIMLISRVIGRLASKKTDGGGSAAIAAGLPPAAAPAAAPGKVDLYNVEEPTAAVIMALVAHNSGIAPERLAFRSIRLIEEE